MVLSEETLNSAEFLFRLALMSGTPVNILQHLPIFVKLRNSITEYLKCIDSALIFNQHESQKTMVPLLEYLIEQNEILLFLRCCGSEIISNPNSPFSQKVAATFIQKYGSGTAAIQELSSRRSMMNEAAIDNLVIAIIFHCHDDTADLADSIHKSASRFSIDKQLALYAKTHDDEIWQLLENQLLQLTNSLRFQLIITTIVNQCNAYADCHLLEKLASSIANKLHGSQKNHAIKQLIDECYEVLDAPDLAGFQALVGAIDPNYTCFFEGSSIPIQFMISTEDRVMNNRNRHFTTTQRALLRHIFPTIITELRRDPQRIGGSTIMHAALTYAQADEEASSKVLLDLHAETCAAQKIVRTQEEILKDTAVIIDILCRQKRFGQAVSVFTEWSPLSELQSLLTRGDYQLATAVKYLIAQLGDNKATTELVYLYNVFDHPQRLSLATDFLKAGLSFEVLRPSLKVLDAGGRITLLANIYKDFDGLDHPGGDPQLAKKIYSELLLFPTTSIEIQGRIRFKYGAVYSDLLAQLKTDDTVPQAPQTTELIASLKNHSAQYTPQQLATQLRSAGYAEDEVKRIFTESFGQLPPKKMLTDHSTMAVLERLGGIINPFWIEEFKKNKWDAAYFSEAWDEGYPNLMLAQAENVQLMAQLEFDRPGIIAYLNKRFGIHCFSRIDRKMWRNMFDERKSNKQWVFVIFSRIDHNGALSKPAAYSDLHSQLGNTHSLVFCEAASLEAVGLQLMRAYIAYSQNKKGNEKKCGLIIVDWHGYEDSGILLSKKQGVGDVKSQDVISHPESAVLRDRYLQDSCLFVSLGCSTGVSFVPTVGKKLGFSRSSGPQIPTRFERFEVKYASDNQHLASVRPLFADSPTLTYDQNGAQEPD